MKKNNQGLTLIELLIAVSILSIVLMPFMNSFVKSMEINNKTENTIEASFIAQKFLENIKYIDDITTIPLTDEYNGFTVDFSFSDITGDLKIKNDSTITNTGNIVLPDSYDKEIKYYETESDGSKLLIGSNNYNSSNDIYTLVIENDGSGIGVLNLTLETGISNDLGTIDINTETIANIKINVASSISENGKLILKNLSDKKIAFYEFDDESNSFDLEPFVSINAGDVEIINNLKTFSQNGKNNSKLYSVEIIVSKDGTVFEKIISTVKK